MKKLAVLLLIAAMSVSMMACGSKGGAASQNTQNQDTKDEQTETADKEQNHEMADNTGEADNDAADNADAANNNGTANDSGTDAEADTVGNILVNDFKERTLANPAVSAQELADGILSNSAIQFQGMAMPVEPGLLTGLGNAEITGFKEGVMFAPMISSIPFVGYIFVLEDGTDIEDFKSKLSENADPRWNICTEADETMIESADNIVFFLMCPSVFEEEQV